MAFYIAKSYSKVRMKATPETPLVLADSGDDSPDLGLCQRIQPSPSSQETASRRLSTPPSQERPSEVYSGTYQESLQIGKQIVLRGIDSGSGLPQVVTDRGSAITIKGSGVILEGIWAKSASGWTGDAGILVTSNSNILRNNMASGSGNTGILLQMCVNNTHLLEMWPSPTAMKAYFSRTAAAVC